MKRIMVIAVIMVLALTSIAVAAPVVPFTGATWTKASFSGGQQIGAWETDLGTYYSDVPARIEDGRVLIPMRFALEPLGGRVEWGSYSDGSTAWATFYAPPVRTVTVLVNTPTVTVTNTVVVTATVYIATPQNVLRTKNDMPQAFYPPYFLQWWGVAPIPSTLTTFSAVTVYIEAPNATVFTAQFMADKWGFFEGSYMLNEGIEPGNWRIVAVQGGWFSEVTFTILGPPVILEP